MSKPAKHFGAIAFYNIIGSGIITYFIIILSGVLGWKIDLSLLIKILAFHFGVFMTVWGAIFGSDNIKRFKG